jgi:carboxyl-terminal processing protease
MFEKAIKAYLHKLDPHSDYISPSEYKAMNERSAGQYGGLGIQVQEDQKTGVALVVKPFDGTPAQRAGIKSGDRVIAVNGILTETSDEAIDKMTGVPGTAVEVVVYREGEKKPLKLNMVREVIKIESVETAMLGDVGYLKLKTFSEEGVSKKVEDGIKKLKEDNSDLKGFIIDVRDNGGGLLTEGKKISELFLREGAEVVTLKDKAGKITESYKAKGGDIADGLPITVLTNGYSASASEIFAGTMKGNHRALIAGTTTFGKGSVQSVFPLSAIFNDPTMEGAFKVTTQLFFMPNGSGGLMSNQGIGITPDIVYQPPKNAEQLGLIEMRKEAMMEGMIANPDGKKTSETTTKSFCTASVGADLEAKDLQKPLIDEDHKADYALICAVNALNEDSDLKNLTSITPAVPNVPPTAMNLTQ